MQSGHSQTHGLPRRGRKISTVVDPRKKPKSRIDAPLVGMNALVADEVALPSEGFGAALEGAIERPFAPMLVNEVVEVHREWTSEWV